jgi:hypothetical protein
MKAVLMLVLCNGMPRSASTWSYNVARELLRLAGTGEVFGGYDENLHRFLRGLPASASHAVLKCHSLDPTGIGLTQLGAAKVIYTWRDVADATASFMAMFDVDFEHTIAVMSSSLDLYRRHCHNGALILSYAEITGHPVASVRKVDVHLHLDLPDDAIAVIAEETSLRKMRERVDKIGSLDYGHHLLRHERSSYDPETLLHINHIRDGGSGYGAMRLNDGQRRRIEELLREKGLME